MIERRMYGKFVRSFLDVIVMTMLNGTPMYGYEVMATVHKEFGVLLSPGTLYPLLHSLEGKGLIRSSHNTSRIVYQTTSKGKQKFRTTLGTLNLAVKKMMDFIRGQNQKIILPV